MRKDRFEDTTWPDLRWARSDKGTKTHALARGRTSWCDRAMTELGPLAEPWDPYCEDACEQCKDAVYGGKNLRRSALAGDAAFPTRDSVLDLRRAHLSPRR